MTAIALPGAALKLAYLGQQEGWRSSCDLVGRAVRRLVVGKEVGLNREHLATLRRRYKQLLADDLANVDAGLYPSSLLFQIPYRQYARVAPRLAADIPRVVLRRSRGNFRDLPPNVERFPAYYRRTFHWQSDGYFSRKSAALYDLGVELLFGGTADVMRRQVLPPIVRAARKVGRPRILDVACGTGRALSQLCRAVPDAEYDAVDLSRWYLQQAAENVPAAVRLTEANAESLPYDDASFDVTYSVYLFHELPRAARRNVWREMKRVTKPGGTIVIMDSIQRTDVPEMAFFLERFNAEMHEPFFREYQRDDLAEGLAEVGLQVDAVGDHFLSKSVTARRV